MFHGIGTYGDNNHQIKYKKVINFYCNSKRFTRIRSALERLRNKNEISKPSSLRTNGLFRKRRYMVLKSIQKVLTEFSFF